MATGQKIQSKVWDKAEVVQEGKTWRCKLCPENKCVYESSATKASGLTGLISRHLISHHPNDPTVIALQKEKEDRQRIKKENEDLKGANPSAATITTFFKKAKPASDTTTPNNSKVPLHAANTGGGAQPEGTLDTFFKKGWLRIGTINNQTKKADLALCLAFVMHDIPWSFSESRYFKDVFTLGGGAFPRSFKPPSAKYLRTKVLQQLNDSVKGTVESEMTSKEFYGASGDIWSSPNMDGVLVLNVARILKVEDEFKFVVSLLNSCEMPSKHGGKETADQVTSMIEKSPLLPKNMAAFTSDNASAMQTAAQELDKERIPCGPHTINLAVQA